MGDFFELNHRVHRADVDGDAEEEREDQQRDGYLCIRLFDVRLAESVHGIDERLGQEQIEEELGGILLLRVFHQYRTDGIDITGKIKFGHTINLLCQ